MLTLATLVLYCTSAFLIYRRSIVQTPNGFAQQRWVCLTPVLFALALHTLLLNQNIYQDEGFNLSIYTSASLISWLVCVQILLASTRRSVETLGILMFPVTAIVVALNNFIMPDSVILHSISSGIQSHILISIVAYSLLMMGALQAFVFAFQHQALKGHHPTGIVKKLPSLFDMECFLFQILTFSFIFLSAALISGFLSFDDLFAQHLVHKTILSIIGWGALATLLMGRQLFGWRGKTAIRWTFISFGFILLAYFGSKFVLEILLNS